MILGSSKVVSMIMYRDHIATGWWQHGEHPWQHYLAIITEIMMNYTLHQPEFHYPALYFFHRLTGINREISSPVPVLTLGSLPTNPKDFTRPTWDLIKSWRIIQTDSDFNKSVVLQSMTISIWNSMQQKKEDVESGMRPCPKSRLPLCKPTDRLPQADFFTNTQLSLRTLIFVFIIN